ncbi:MAG: glutathione S-transferase family protein [Hyphomicrobiaceae bacterium]|nr:MAG: glutathione S-transferase family protein [Hyphomicrobiaceae bacterium]
MITLFTFGPAFGLPDPSPFVTKAWVLLQMSGLPFRNDTRGFRKAPKGKLPYIDDEGTIVADSSFVRMHLEERHGVDFDKGLAPAERGIAWAFEKMCEDHLYWALVHDRWMNDANFDRGPRQFFAIAPAPLRPLVIAMVRRGVRRDLHGQGIGRHSREEIAKLAARGIDAIAAQLGDKPYLMGSAPCGADATIFACVAGLLCPRFDSLLRAAAERHANLVAYRDRGMQHWFPASVDA